MAQSHYQELKAFTETLEGMPLEVLSEKIKAARIGEVLSVDGDPWYRLPLARLPTRREWERRGRAQVFGCRAFHPLEREAWDR